MIFPIMARVKSKTTLYTSSKERGVKGFEE